MKLKLILSLFLLVSTASFAQMEAYEYKRDLKNVSEHWHKLVLPNEIF